MFKILIVLCCFLLGTVLSAGYYWRDFTGKIPYDAFPGGKENGDLTFIGRYFKSGEGIFPIPIRVGDISPTIYWTKSYLKILCTDDPNGMEWIPVNRTHFAFITINRRLVRGGLSAGNWVHIGRVSKGEKVIIGRIYSGRSLLSDATLTYTDNVDTSTFPNEVYEVLAFVNRHNRENEDS